METRSAHCPNCSAPLRLPVGEVESVCEYCASHLRFVPSANELEVVRTREEMKYRERVAVHKRVLRNRLEQEEMEKWRGVAARVAIAALPMVGGAAGRALFTGVATRGGGCLGCGCLSLIAIAVALGALLVRVLERF